jgi:HK97 family phage major capsid protein
MAKSNIHALRQRKIEMANAQRALLDKAAEEGRALNESEDAKFDDNIKVLASIEKSIVREEQLMELERGMVGVTDENTTAAVAAGAPGNDKPKFKSIGEQLQAVAKAYRSDGRVTDPRLIHAAASGMNESVPSDGGFLVQPDFASEIFQRSYQLGEILSRCRKRSLTTSNTMKQNAIDETSRVDGSRSGGVLAYWANEADTVTSKKIKFRQMEWRLNKLFALYYATDEELADAPFLAQVSLDKFTEEVQFKAEDAVWEGDGSGKPLGMMNESCLVTVSKETSQASTTLVSENVLKMNARLWAPSQANAVWFVNQDVLPQLPQLNIKIKNVAGSENVGGILTPIYQFPSMGAPAGTILGKKVVPVEYASSLGTLGDIVLADLNQYQLVDKGGIESASSMHVRFLNDEMAFRLTFRLDGHALWNSALTPFKGSNTLSPFVTLQAR